MPAEPTAVATAPSPALGLATLATWLLTAGLGAFMLSRLIASGGLRQQRATRGGLSPTVLFGHFSLAGTGLVVWVCYVATGWVALAWSAVGLLMPAIGLGVSTVTLWTPYPRPGRAAGADPHADPSDGLRSRYRDHWPWSWRPWRARLARRQRARRACRSRAGPPAHRRGVGQGAHRRCARQRACRAGHRERCGTPVPGWTKIQRSPGSYHPGRSRHGGRGHLCPRRVVTAVGATR